MLWFVYIAKCRDNSLYTGITTNPRRREYEHNHDRYRGAKSLIGKRPIRIIYIENCNNKKDAMKREREIKGWRREKKIKLIKGLS